MAPRGGPELVKRVIQHMMLGVDWEAGQAPAQINASKEAVAFQEIQALLGDPASLCSRNPNVTPVQGGDRTVDGFGASCLD